jgi:hypothetical protein
MRIAILVALAMLCYGGKAQAQLYPDRYGYAWYPRQYAEGYYRAPYYGGGGMWSGCPGCYGRPSPQFSYHYAPHHYALNHHRYSDRDGWAYSRGFGRW